MHDFIDDYEMDEDGRLHRQRVAGDGDRISFATISDHVAYGFTPRFSDGSIDHTNPHQKGFRFADSNDANRIAANEAHEQNRARMSDAWRRPAPARL